MSIPIQPVAEARREPRLKLPAMYTLLRARAAGDDRYRWTGYIYDISVTGMRFELDHALTPGDEIEVRGMLPAGRHTTFRATGRVVRIHDDEDAGVGPVRMAMQFTTFTRDTERERLVDYLAHAGVLRKAA
jgi:c-di-GMP-binding flagellar brake protein YcgR